MPDIQGITHWALGVNDLAKSERFYTEVVGWEPRGRLNPKMSCFRVCGLDVLLCECPRPDRSDGQRNLVHHSFSFSSEGWVEAARHLHSKGIKPDEVIYRETGYFPGREIYFHDPSGNRIEFRDPRLGAGDAQACVRGDRLLSFLAACPISPRWPCAARG